MSKQREYSKGEPCDEKRMKYQYSQLQSKLRGYATRTGLPRPACFLTQRDASVMAVAGVSPSRHRRARSRPLTARASSWKSSDIGLSSLYSTRSKSLGRSNLLPSNEPA